MISVDEAKKLAAVLEVPVAYILTVDDERKAEDNKMPNNPLADEFNFVYDACSDKGRKYLERAINAAKSAFIADRRKKNRLRGK